MTTDSSTPQGSSSECVNALVEDYLEQQLRGVAPSIAEFVKLHPEQAVELTELLETVLVVDRLGPHQAAHPQSEEFPETEFPEIDDYRLLRIAGQGGMGVVYEAVQISLDRCVALKILPTPLLQGRNARERFLLEARTAAKLHHTNIVPVFDVGEHNGHCFYTMQFIDGDTLDTVVRKLQEIRLDAFPEKKPRPASPAGSSNRQPPSPDLRALTIALSLKSLTLKSTVPSSRNSSIARSEPVGPQALVDTRSLEIEQTSTTASRSDTKPFFFNVARIGHQAAVALHCAHEHGIVHRDIKPSNLILDTSGHLWITDFGLAKLNDADGLTQAGDVVGTLRYMSPERFSGRCDCRSDIYSLGASLYELIALRAPFDASDRVELINQIKQGDVPKLRVLNRRVPYDLQTIVEKAMHPLVARRYPTALALADDLQRFVHGEPIWARRVNSAERVWLWAFRNPVVASLTLCFLLGLLTVSIAASLAAVKFKRMADTQLLLTKEANESRAESIRSLYNAETNLASQNIDSRAGIVNIRAYVKHWATNPGAIDPRGWEWHFLDAFAQREDKVLNLQELDGLERPPAVLGVDYSPDGKTVAHISDRVVVIRDSQTLQELARLEGHESWILAIEFSPDGERIATASEDRTLRIWNWRQSKMIHRIDTQEAIEAVSWNPHADELVFVNNGLFMGDKSLHVVDAKSGQIIHSKYDGNIANNARTSGYSSDGKLFAIPTMVGHEYGVAVLSTDDWTTVATKMLHRGSVFCAFSNHDDSLIASASMDGTVRTWNFRTDATQLVYQSLDGIPIISWSPQGSCLAIAAWDHTLQVWDATSTQMLLSLRGHENKLYAVAWHPKIPVLMSSDWNGNLRRWKLTETSGMQEYRLPLPEKNDAYLRMRVAWSSDGAQLAVGNGSETKLWNFEPQQFPVPSVTFPEHSFPTWSPDGLQLATSNRLGAAVRNADGTQLQHEVAWGEEKRFLSWSSNSRDLLLTEFPVNTPAYLWRLDFKGETTPKKIAGPFKYIVGVDFSPDGKYAALALLDNNVPIVELSTGEVVCRLQSTGFNENIAVAWSSDGTRLATAGAGLVVEIWDTTSWERTQTLTGHTFSITGLAWNATDNRLASASRDKTIRVWDTTTFRTTMILHHNAEVGDIAWSPSGEKLASVSIDGVVKVWNASKSYRRLPSVTTN